MSDDVQQEPVAGTGDWSPYPALKVLREQRGVHIGWPDMGMLENVPGEDPTFMACSYEAVRAVFADNDTFSSRCYEKVTGPLMGRTILEMDEPEHRTYRQLQQRAFARASMDRWEAELVGPLVQARVAEFENDGHADLVEKVFDFIPIRVIAALLGLPAADIPEFHRLGTDLISFTQDMDGALDASAALGSYFMELLAARRDEPRDDLITMLATVEHDGQRLTDDEIIGFLRNLLPAGAETTARSSANLTFALLTHPEQFAAVVQDRSLLPQAIEEGLRWETPLLNFIRLVAVDTTLEGVEMPAGATVVVNLGSANRDDAHWEDPDSFDIYRAAKPHLSFGHGAHLCLGLHLARMETTVMCNTVFDRLPGLRLDPDAPAPYISGQVFRSPPRLDVVWNT